MKITCNRQKFAAAFAIASSAVPARTPKDILKNVFMSITKDGVQLVGTDQEIAIRYTVSDITTSSVGDVLLPTQRLSSILRELTDESVELDIDYQQVHVRSQSGKFRLVSEDPKEYPPVPEFTDKEYFQIPAAVFRRMIRRTVFATDTESTRYAIGGLLLEFTENTVALVATDSRRLAVATGSCEKHGNPAIPTKTTVVPTKAMQMLERSIDPKSDYVDVSVHDNHVMMRSGDCTVYSRLVEGRFPKYQAVIPKRSEVTVPLPVGPFFAAVRQSQIVTDEENRGVEFMFNNAVLAIKSHASAGESKVELPIEYDAQEIRITFDPKYVADFLKVLSPEMNIDLKLTDADTAAVFTVEDSYTYVIMPLAKDR